MSLLNLESLQVSIGSVQAVRDVSLSLQEPWLGSRAAGNLSPP